MATDSNTHWAIEQVDVHERHIGLQQISQDDGLASAHRIADDMKAGLLGHGLGIKGNYHLVFYDQ